VSCGVQGVMPDIVTMAKGIGNGLPLAAVVTTPEIAQVGGHQDEVSLTKVLRQRPL
jgi:4-aminobutyrate aminotransferase-like enzyme